MSTVIKKKKTSNGDKTLLHVKERPRRFQAREVGSGKWEYHLILTYFQIRKLGEGNGLRKSSSKFSSKYSTSTVLGRLTFELRIKTQVSLTPSDSAPSHQTFLKVLLLSFHEFPSLCHLAGTGSSPSVCLCVWRVCPGCILSSPATLPPTLTL